MPSSPLTTLFENPQQPRTGPSSFAGSVMAHAVVLGLMVLAITHAPNIIQPATEQHYTVRILTVQRTGPQLHYLPGGGGAQGGAHAMAHTVRSGDRPAAAPAPRQLAARIQARQTLIQPNAPANVPLLATNVPVVVMWTPESVPVPKIIPPPPQKAAAVVTPPTLAAPNHESHIADVQLSSSTVSTQTIPLAASTTSPIALHSAGMAKIPETASKYAGQPTPATVLSVSDVLMPQGTIVLPLADQTGAGVPSDMLARGTPGGTSDALNGNAKGQQDGSGGRSGDQGGQESAANGGPSGEGSGADTGSRAGSGGGASAGAGGGNPFAVDRIEQAKDGNFGVVVIGTSLAEDYPETLGIWAGRLAYTVYLHVGLTKNWIMQYALPRVVKSTGGGRPDAPWPYLMVRPHLMPTDPDADAIMVHGFINSGGRFEQLAVVFPPQFAETKFVLGSLQQWQFRPATENGQQTPVEVLLIIPDESE